MCLIFLLLLCVLGIKHCLHTFNSISGYESDDITTSGSSGRVENISEKFWFRVAVIVVPILGGLILLGIIVLACTMLKSDWRKVSDGDRLLASADLEGAHHPSNQHQLIYCEKLGYKPKPFPGYLRTQLRHYHSDTTLTVVSDEQKTKEEQYPRPSTVLFSGVS